MIQTKNFYLPDTAIFQKSMQDFNSLGYSLSIPWNDINTSGWANIDPGIMKMWGTENKLLVKSDPEYYAPGNLIRSNVLPNINVNDPIYKFERSAHTYKVW